MSAIQKYSDVVKRIEFCDDFGEGPLLLGHITTDRSIIAVVSLLGGFVAMAGLGFPGALFVAFAALNDLSYSGNVEADDEDNNPKTEVTTVDGAIDVVSVSVDESIAPGVAVAPSMQHIVSPVWNPAQDLGENPQSALIVGVPGSGKGILISNAIRVLKAKVPSLKVFVIDPKASPKERGYWESIADEYRAFSLKNCEDPDEGAAWLLSCMDAFRRLPGPKLCIFDELMTAATELELSDSKMKALPKLKKFVVGLVGQGDSEAEWLWAMTQSPQVKDLGMSGGVRANLRVIGLVSPKNMTAVEALVSTQLIPKPDGGMDELRSIMAASPVGRAVFDGKIARWLPMPELENHSGFDRDNRSLSDEVPETRSTSPFVDPVHIARMQNNNAMHHERMMNALEPEEKVEQLERLWNIPSVEVEIETTAIDDRPEGLDDFPLVLTIWEYLHGKDARSMKQIRDAMRKTGRISEDNLRAKLPAIEGYNEALKTVIQFGVGRGFLKEVSEDTYEAIKTL